MTAASATLVLMGPWARDTHTFLRWVASDTHFIVTACMPRYIGMPCHRFYLCMYCYHFILGYILDGNVRCEREGSRIIWPAPLN